MGRLEIRVCGARNLANIQKVGMIDPYVKVKYGDKKDKKTFIKYRSRVIENSQNPTWNELFKFQIADYDSSQILFQVWNDNVISDDLLGSYSLSLNGLDRGVVKDYWALLTGTEKSSSELHLRILAVDFGGDPPAGAKVISSLEEDNMSAPSNQTSRPPKKDTNPYGGAAPTTLPVGPPAPVSYGQTPVHYAPPPQPVYAPQQPMQPPPQPMYRPPQPMYGAPPPQQQPAYRPPQQAYPAPPPPPPQQPAVQYASGIPPF